jgi:hypothetical protein
LDIIRRLKEVMTKWEEMIKHENGRAVRLEAHADGCISAGADQPASRPYVHSKHDHTRRKTSKKTLNSSQLELLYFDSNSTPDPCSESMESTQSVE